MQYLAVAALVGVLLFYRLVLVPSLHRQGLAASVLPTLAGPYNRLLWLSWTLLLGAAVAALLIQTSLANGGGLLATFGKLPSMLLDTRYGLVWLARLGLLLALALALRWLQRPGLTWLVIGLAGLVMITSTLNSHSAAVPSQPVLAITAHWLHFLAVSVWVGGLFTFVLLLPLCLRSLPPATRWSLLARIIPRFSVLAMLSVALLSLTGLYLAWLHIGSLAALRDTLYGKSLVVKLGLAAPVLALGAANLLIFSPRLTAAVSGVGDLVRATRLGVGFGRTVRVEAALATLVLLAAGVLSSLPPGRQTYERIEATRPLVLNTEAGSLHLALTIAPARPGPNTFTLFVADGKDQPVNNAERVDLRFTYLDEALGTSVQIAEPQGDGRYVTRGAFVAVDGEWQIEMLVRQAGREDARSAVRFAVTATSAQAESSPTVAGPRLPLPTFNLSLWLALGLVLLGVALILFLSRAIGLRSLEGAALSLAGVVIIGLGVFLAVRSQPIRDVAAEDRHDQVEGELLRNPFPPTGDSLALGERVYRDNCQACHGANGRGDGPAASALNPRPADFRVHMAAGHPDGEHFSVVTGGKDGTAMPSFKDRLSVDERWHVINFLKTFAPVPP